MATTIVPAFFVIDLPAEEANEHASLIVEASNQLNASRDQHGALGPRTRLFLCEESPSTELEDEALVPTSLEGLTCDAGSDRSATALIQRISAYGEANDTSQPTETLSAILQIANGWLRQRMTLHPQASTEPAPGIEHQDSGMLLLHAYAKADAEGYQIGRAGLRDAFQQALFENPGVYHHLCEQYREQDRARRANNAH